MEAARRATVDDLDAILDLAAELRGRARCRCAAAACGRVTAAYPDPLDATFGALLDRDDACLLVGTIDDVDRRASARAASRCCATAPAWARSSSCSSPPEARAVSVGEGILGQLVELVPRGRAASGVDAFALPGHRAAKNFFETAGFTARALVMHHELKP